MTTLDERLESHATWLRTAGDEGDRLVLAHERHLGIDLAGRDLTGAWIHDCDLTGASLRDVWLNRAELHGSTLDHADLSGARLVKAEGRGVSARSTAFTNADLTRLWASAWRLTGADLTRCYLLRTDFDDCDLTGARLVEADLDRTRFGRCVLGDNDAAGAAGTIAPEAARNLDAVGLVDLLRSSGATDITVFDRSTFDRQQLRPWRNPLADDAPPTST